jgi:hypothetical protein
MIDATAGGDVRAGLSALLDDLEFHRAFDVEDRLARAIRLGQQAFAVGALDLQMRGRLVESDMRLRIGQATEAAHLATEVNHWAREHGPPALLARSHLILSSIFESIGDSASCLDNALRALELLDDDTPVRTRGNFLVRLADALSVAGSFDAARQRYREAEQHSWPSGTRSAGSAPSTTWPTRSTKPVTRSAPGTPPRRCAAWPMAVATC